MVGKATWKPLEFPGQSYHQKGAQGLVCVFRFCSQHSPHVDMLLWPISLLNQRAANFLWILEQVKTLQQDQAAVQAVPTCWTIGSSTPDGT